MLRIDAVIISHALAVVLTLPVHGGEPLPDLSPITDAARAKLERIVAAKMLKEMAAEKLLEFQPQGQTQTDLGRFIVTAVNYGDRIKLTTDGDAFRIESAPVPPPAPTVELPATFPHGVPNFAYQPTVFSVKSGDAADPATWGGAVPNSDDRVLILPDHDVDLPEGQHITSYSLGIWGELKPRGGSWRAKDFQVIDYDGKRGLLDIEDGSGALVIRDIATTEPSQWGTCLIVQGDWIGKAATRVKAVYIAGDLPAGVDRIPMERVPHDWQVGDEIALPRMSQSDLPENERGRIKTLENDAVILEQPTAHPHEIVYEYENPRDWKNSGKSVKSLPVIVNLTRGFEIRSENPDGTRGHVVVTGHGHCDIEGVRFTELGRTLATGFGELRDNPTVSQVARYGMHFHHQHGEPCSVRNCVIDVGDKARNLRWGMSVHATHDSIVQSNVFIGNIGEAHLVTEDGQETRNRITDNLSIGGADGFWWYGPRNYIEGNIAYGVNRNFDVDNTGAGHHIGYRNDGNGRRVPGVITFPANAGDPHGEQVTMRLEDAVPLSFKNNGAIGSWSGLRVWKHGYSDPVIVDDFFVGHCRQGMSIYYERGIVINRPAFYSDAEWAVKHRSLQSPNGSANLAYGFVLGTRSTREAVINEPELHGWYAGIYGRQSGGGDSVTINGGTLNNVHADIHVRSWGAATLNINEVKTLHPTNGVLMQLDQHYNDQPQVVTITRDGKTYRLYFAEQADPAFKWTRIYPGKTNAELWPENIYLCGAKPSCDGSLPGVVGIACPITEENR